MGLVPRERRYDGSVCSTRVGGNRKAWPVVVMAWPLIRRSLPDIRMCRRGTVLLLGRMPSPLWMSASTARSKKLTPFP